MKNNTAANWLISFGAAMIASAFYAPDGIGMYVMGVLGFCSLLVGHVYWTKREK